MRFLLTTSSRFSDALRVFLVHQHTNAGPKIVKLINTYILIFTTVSHLKINWGNRIKITERELWLVLQQLYSAALTAEGCSFTVKLHSCECDKTAETELLLNLSER